MYYVKINVMDKKSTMQRQTAIEYFLLNEKLDEPILLFYVNENAIIIGKNKIPSKKSIKMV